MLFNDPLQSKQGRLTFFSAQYGIQGLLLGLVGGAIATDLRRRGVSNTQLGMMMAAYYGPWGFKWVVGPLMDRWGSTTVARRRGTLLTCQSALLSALLLCSRANPVQEFGLLVMGLAVAGVALTVADVATDALACAMLPRAELGRANGVMFAASAAGTLVGGSGGLLTSGLGADWQFTVAAAVVSLVMVTLTARLGRAASAEPAEGNTVRATISVRDEVRSLVQRYKALLTPRMRLLLLFAFLPCGAMCLGTPVQTSLGVDMGLSNEGLAGINTIASLCAVVGSLVGGSAADRFGSARALRLFILALCAPEAVLLAALLACGWSGVGKPAGIAGAGLLAIYWGACIAYALLTAMMYAARAALCMAVTSRDGCAAEFTAMMGMSNLATAFADIWQGAAADKLGYATTLGLDLGTGLLCLGALALVAGTAGTAQAISSCATSPPPDQGGSDERATARCANGDA